MQLSFGKFCDAIQIASGAGWEILEFPYIRNIFSPTGQSFIYRFAGSQNIQTRRKISNYFTLILISRADLDGFQTVEHVQFGDGQTGETVEADGIV